MLTKCGKLTLVKMNVLRKLVPGPVVKMADLLFVFDIRVIDALFLQFDAYVGSYRVKVLSALIEGFKK